MDIRVEYHLDDIASPANLRINDQINAFREACAKEGCHASYHHFAFGQSPYSPPLSAHPTTRALRRAVKVRVPRILAIAFSFGIY